MKSELTNFKRKIGNILKGKSDNLEFTSSYYQIDESNNASAEIIQHYRGLDLDCFLARDQYQNLSNFKTLFLISIKL